MTSLLRLKPFFRPSDRIWRLPGLVLGVLVLLLLSIWDPITTPGPLVCLSRAAFGLPCPFCGVTRGVSLCLRGHPIQASTYNLLTVPLFVIGLLVMTRWAVEYIVNARVVFTLTPPWRRLRSALVAFLLLGGWIYLLTYRREDDFAASWLGQLLHHFW